MSDHENLGTVEAPRDPVLVERRQQSIVITILYLGTTVSAIIALAIIGAVIVLTFKGSTVPEILSNWGGIIIGFYFGTLSGFIKDVISEGH